MCYVLRFEKATCLSRAAVKHQMTRATHCRRINIKAPGTRLVKHQNLAESGDRLSLESAHLIGLPIRQSRLSWTDLWGGLTYL